MSRSLADSYLKSDGTPITEADRTKTFVDMFTDRDPRMAETIMYPGFINEGDNSTLPTKIVLDYGGLGQIKFLPRTDATYGGWGENITDLPIIRYADVLLIFAEAENEANGPTAAAYDAVNQLRVRAGLDNLSGLSKETFRQAIQKEWTLETTHERIYRFNLVRWGTYLTVMKEYFQKNFPEKVKNVTEERLYFPCPEHDSLINPNL